MHPHHCSQNPANGYYAEPFHSTKHAFISTIYIYIYTHIFSKTLILHFCGTTKIGIKSGTHSYGHLANTVQKCLKAQKMEVHEHKIGVSHPNNTK